ncbi:MAG TPA: HDIG domain-containing protein [Desulfobacteraceae bacterium]|nr:HDIG domain-containing protein [Desulfobacteraceae bacterium]
MEPAEIIRKFYPPGSKGYEVLIRHSESVAEKSLAIADHNSRLNPDREFIHQAAMLHDIGIFKTDAPDIGCFGSAPYICHGVLGGALLQEMGLEPHALVSERHTGAGITAENIETNGLPLPCREMVPLTLEEKIVCVADKFFSKSPGQSGREKSMEEIVQGLEKTDPSHARRFLLMAEELRLSSSD